MKNTIISISLIFLIALCAVLRLAWSGFVFVALILFMALCLYWVYVLVIGYYEEFVESFDDEFKMYCAKLINFNNVSQADISSNEEFYKKKFKKSLHRDKLIEFAKMAIVITFFLVCVGAFVGLIIK